MKLSRGCPKVAPELTDRYNALYVTPTQFLESTVTAALASLSWSLRAINGNRLLVLRGHLLGLAPGPRTSSGRQPSA
jgi:hypothetical protein